MAHIKKIVHPSGKVSWRARWYIDGKSRSKNFDRKGDAQGHLDAIIRGAGSGSATDTITDLARDFLRTFEELVRSGERERVTLDGYSTALDRHVANDKAFAKTRLADLTTARAQLFLDGLLERGVSANAASKVRRAMVQWADHGQRRGLLTHNPIKATKVVTTSRPEAGEDRCDIPPKDQLGKLLKAAGQGPTPERDTAIVRLLMFSGLRISELLGLPDDAALSGVVKIRERMDSRYAVPGRLKSKGGRRDIPIGPEAQRAIKVWRMRRGPSLQLVINNERMAPRLFPNPDNPNAPWDYHSFRHDMWNPLMERAGLLERIRDSKNIPRPMLAFGPHQLRHVAASLWIAQNTPAKKVQQLLGHSSIRMTMDLYGHLWHDADEDSAIAKASEALISG